MKYWRQLLRVKAVVMKRLTATRSIGKFVLPGIASARLFKNSFLTTDTCAALPARRACCSAGMNTDKNDLKAFDWEFHLRIGVHPCLSVLSFDLLNSLLESVS